MSRDVRTIFAGSDDFSRRVFDGLLKDGTRFVALLTQPDKPHGRGLAPSPSALKKRALEVGIPVLQPAKLRDAQFHRELSGRAPDLLLVVSFGRILPREVLALFPKGAINVHPSLLPAFRGAAPVQRALLNGETTSGVTIFYLQERMDAGPVIRQHPFSVPPDATAGDVYDTVVTVSLPELQSILKDLKTQERLPAAAQDDSKATLAPKLAPADLEMNWRQTVGQAHNRVRALNPRPGAHTSFRGKRVKIWRTRVGAGVEIARPAEAEDTGAVVAHGNRVFAACRDGWLEILEVQPEGRRRCPAAEWLHGLRLVPAERFESVSPAAQEHSP